MICTQNTSFQILQTTPEFTHSFIEQNEDLDLYFLSCLNGIVIVNPESLSWPGKVYVKAIGV